MSICYWGHNQNMIHSLESCHEMLRLPDRSIESITVRSARPPPAGRATDGGVRLCGTASLARPRRTIHVAYRSVPRIWSKLAPPTGTLRYMCAPVGRKKSGRTLRLHATDGCNAHPSSKNVHGGSRGGEDVQETPR